ncbi:LytR/AlgR family response regulator transcription factor [Spongiimicrobium sp. 3-5]|uniref:LytR/AlgR family response regulator transcription factor n=1 Tax=Spongiimicrobium sp. 3-5 TaxID=3332596 RepID=UPI00397EA6E6
MLKAIIVDDEQHCIDRIMQLLSGYQETLTLAGSGNTVSEALKLINSERPDVVFLDVHLNDETGFDLLRKLISIDFEIVFTTAYDKYAVEAFRFSALDYLLKPVDAIEFEETITRIREKTGLKDTTKKIEALFHNFEHKVKRSKKIIVPTLDGLILLTTNDIIRCQSDGNYTNIFHVGDKKITATKTLKHFEELLGEDYFFRIHKSHFINMAFVEKYLKGKGGYVLMADGSHIEVAVRRKEEFLKKLKE